MVQKADTTKDWFTRAQLADELNISPQRVSELRTRGILIAKRNLYARDNIQRFQEYQEAYLVARKNTEPAEIIAQQVRLVRERANQNLIEYIREYRSLIDARIVRDFYAHFNAVIPAVLERIVDKLSPRIAHIDEKPIIGDEISRYVRVALRACRRAINRFDIQEEYEIEIPEEILWPNTFDKDALDAARVEKVRHLANLQELRTGRMRGRYHEIESFEQVVCSMFGTIKQRLEGLPNSCVNQAVNRSEEEIRDLIVDYLKENVVRQLRPYDAENFNSRTKEVIIADVASHNAEVDAETQDEVEEEGSYA
jgi:phage terminase Nu1 subunit (DNA packaging protein)